MNPQHPSILRSAFFAAMFALSAGTTTAATYYVDSINGLDTNNGTSTATPWKTPAKVSATTFAAGDTINFRRNQQFVGSLTLNGSGSSGNPINLNAYGTGNNKPIIVGGNGTTAGGGQAILIANRSWWTIQNLEIQAPTGDGVVLQGASNITIQNCDITNCNYVKQGLYSLCAEYGMGIKADDYNPLNQNPIPYTPNTNVTISNCRITKVNSGIYITSSDNFIVENSYIAHTADFGVCFAGHTTHNILTGNQNPVRNTRVRNCVIDNTNTNTDQWNAVMFGGTSNVYFEMNEVRFTRPYSQQRVYGDNPVDHQVFDFDTSCLNSHIQYNYSHDNYTTLMLNYFLGDPSENGGCTFRYNLSVGDANLMTHAAFANNSYGLKIHNNTFYKFKGTSGRNPIASDVANSVWQNNIFSMNSVLSGTWSNPAGSGYNLYHNATRPAAENATSHNGTPAFVDAARHPHGLRLQAGSPGVNQGTNIASNGGRDYWGNTLYNGAADIGAHEQGAAAPVYANLAYRRTVTASSAAPASWGWSAAALTDGETLSIGAFPTFGGGNALDGALGWSSDISNPNPHTEWVKVDLGSLQSFNRVKLWARNDYGYLGQNYPANFTIDTSPDNVVWTTRVTVAGSARPGRGPQYYSFSAVSARYVRVNMTGVVVAQLAEMEVLSDASTPPPASAPTHNLALAKDVSASSSAENWGWYKSRLTDGQRSTVAQNNAPFCNAGAAHGSAGWTSWPTGSSQEEFTIDLESNVTVARAVLYPRNDAPNAGVGFPVNVQIYTSTDNVNWTIVFSQWGIPNPGSTPLTCNFVSTPTARYVRAIFPSMNPSTTVALAEVEVY